MNILFYNSDETKTTYGRGLLLSRDFGNTNLQHGSSGDLPSLKVFLHIMKLVKLFIL
jgi:hypothetical protein